MRQFRGCKTRFTALFEALATEWLKAASQKAVAGSLHLSWDEIHGCMERAVKRGLERRQAEPVSRIGLETTASSAARISARRTRR
jgi:transposase